jgi:uncharacterized protein (TIGR02996 family)
LQNIAKSPDDLALRRVFADWLEHQGHDAEAEFIRLQCRLLGAERGWEHEAGEQEALQARAQALFQEHRGEWLAGFPDPDGPRWGLENFTSGLLETLVIRTAQMSDEELRELIALTSWRRLLLNGSDVPGGWPLVLQLLKLPACPRWIALELPGVDLGTKGAQSLAADSPLLAHLTCLNLRGGRIGSAGAQALAKSCNWASLTSLNLEGNNLGDRGARAIVASHCLYSLTSLDLSFNGIGDQGTRALARFGQAANLRVLDLGQNEIGAKGVRALAEAKQLARLTSLDLEGNDIGDEGARALAESPYLAYLRYLKLNFSGVSPPVQDLIRRRWPFVQPG